METLKSDRVLALALAIKDASEKEGVTGARVRQRLEETFQAISSRGTGEATGGKADDMEMSPSSSLAVKLIGKDRTKEEAHAASETMAALVKLATYNPEALKEILQHIVASCQSTAADSPAQEVITLMSSVLSEGSSKWRSAASAETISYPKLASTEWQIDVGKEPKVCVELKTEEQSTIRFDASRGMLTVLTDSLKRIKNELQSVSNA